MTGIQMAMFFSGGDSETITVPDTDAFNTNISPGTASATYTLNSNGTSTVTGNPVPPDWVEPQPPANASDYEVRATIQTGSLSSGSTGVWLSLGSNRSWNNTQSSVGIKTANVLIEIREAGGSVLDSAYVNITAEVGL